MPTTRLSRRDVLRTTASAAITLPFFVPSSAMGAADKVQVGIIGLGGRARWLLRRAIPPQMNITAVCDIFRRRCDEVRSEDKAQNATRYFDCREMFDKEHLDGVMIETTTHGRALPTIHAMQAGLDVYIEKPMSLTIAEGRAMVDAARHYDAVTQVGTQQRSMPINNFAADLVRDGAIGKVKTVYAPNFVSGDVWKPQPGQKVPDDLDWNAWCNQTELRPYHPSLHFGWMQWRAYDGGGRSFGVTGWGTHSYDQIQRALGTDATGPVEVVLEEPVAFSTSGPFQGERAKVSMRYANGVTLKSHLEYDPSAPYHGAGLGGVFEGENGTIKIFRDHVFSDPPELVDNDRNPGQGELAETQYHLQDWIDCIKSRQRCTADIEYGQRSTTICYLVNIARDLGRVGEVLKWDPETETFPGDDEANALLSRPRRKGFELPELAAR